MSVCERWEGDLALHATGDLAPARVRRLDAHLAGCATCRERLQRYARDRATLGALGTDPVAEDALRRVRAGVRQALPNPSDGGVSWGRRWWAVATVAASAAVVGATVLVVLQPSQEPQSSSGSGPSPVGEAVEVVVAPPGQDQAVAAPSPPTRPRRVAVANRAPAPHPVEPEVPALSPEEADQLVRALVYVSQLDRLPSADEEPPEEMPTPTSQLARFETDDPNVVIYWLMDSNGGSS